MPKFVEARLKVKRAREHIEDVKARVLSAIEKAPPVVEPRQNADSGKWEVVFHGGGSPEPMIGVICGEVVHAARSALDHAVGEMISLATGTWPGGDSKFEFPIIGDPTKYADAKKRKLDGVPPAAVAFIDAIQPCHRLNIAPPEHQILWILHRLDIEDKHRRLHVLGRGFLLYHLTYKGPHGAFVREQINKWVFPLEDGAVVHTLSLGIDHPKPEMYGDVQFEIAFENPPEARNGEVVAELTKLVDEVEVVLDRLEGTLP